MDNGLNGPNGSNGTTPESERAELVAQMTRWVNGPGIPGARSRNPALQVAARSLALSYVAGAAGPVSAALIARRIGISPQKFSGYVQKARSEFGMRNPWFSGHDWRRSSVRMIRRPTGSGHKKTGGNFPPDS